MSPHLQLLTKMVNQISYECTYLSKGGDPDSKYNKILFNGGANVKRIHKSKNSNQNISGCVSNLNANVCLGDQIFLLKIFFFNQIWVMV